jgi:multidrug resistance efflux pump
MIDGVVGKVLVSPGSVVRPGEPMIEIVGKHRFVVAWFPLSRLYRLQVGDAVTVSTGGANLPGKSPRSVSLPTRRRKNSRRHSRP